MEKKHKTCTVLAYVARAFGIVGFPIFYMWCEGSTSV